MDLLDFRPGPQHAPVPAPAPPARRPSGEGSRGSLEAAVGRLPEPYRAVYVLADLHGLPDAEVGAALGLSRPAVQSRLRRARFLLRAAGSSDGGA
jgi:RNA polymerase sigma-70 factor (ECF subfamily)